MEQKPIYNRRDEFFDYFDIVIANPAQQIEAFKLRHSVYCEELKWEPTKLNQMESDGFDKLATHILIRHKTTGKYAATARFILADRASKLPHAPYFENRINGSFKKHYEKANRLVCEVSRLAVNPAFRQSAIPRNGSFYSGSDRISPNLSRTELNNFSKLTICLFMTCAALVRSAEAESVFIVVRPWLSSKVNGFGFRLWPVSDFCRASWKKEVISQHL